MEFGVGSQSRTLLQIVPFTEWLVLLRTSLSWSLQQLESLRRSKHRKYFLLFVCPSVRHKLRALNLHSSGTVNPTILSCLSSFSAISQLPTRRPTSINFLLRSLKYCVLFVRKWFLWRVCWAWTVWRRINCHMRR